MIGGVSSFSAPLYTSPLAKGDEGQGVSGGAPKGNEPDKLSEGEEKQVKELQALDREVRAHEQAHKIAGGPYASAPQYEFTTGPDNKQYAVGGEVQIDTAPIEGDPDATIAKMDVVIRAALAPAEPSSQDYAVARQAQAARSEAQSERAKENDEEVGAPKGALLEEEDSSDSVNGEVAQALAAYQRIEDSTFAVFVGGLQA